MRRMLEEAIELTEQNMVDNKKELAERTAAKKAKARRLFEKAIARQRKVRAMHEATISIDAPPSHMHSSSILPLLGAAANA